jgi:hypothetical protein
MPRHVVDDVRSRRSLVDEVMRALVERRRDELLIGAAALVAVSGGVHLRLYREQYRDVHVDRVLGVDLASSFVLSVLAATLIAILLLSGVALGRGHRPLALAGFVYAAGAIVAYALSRTVGLLGFEETRWLTEAIVVKPVELIAAIVLGLTLLAPGPPTRAASGSSTGAGLAHPAPGRPAH